MDTPLGGVNVLDFGHYIAGPAVAMALADQGANVIHVDRPGVELHPNDATLNRNKHRVTLDLKDFADRDAISDLIAWADVLIENFRPGVADRLGIGYRAAAEINPSLIYLSLPGFPSDDHQRRDERAFEGNIMAIGGGFMDLSINRTLAGETPTFTPLPLASCYAAAFGSSAIMLALASRARDGLGDHLEVDLYSSLLEGMAYSNYFVEDEPSRYLSLRERELIKRRSDGASLAMNYDDILRLQDPFFRTYICADGRPFYVVSLSHRHHPVRALKALDLWEDACEAGLPLHDPYTSSQVWDEADPCTLFAHPLSREWVEWLVPCMAARFASRTSREWEETFHEFGAVGLAVRSMIEWMQTPHATETGLITNVQRDDRITRQMGPLICMSKNRPRDPSSWWSAAPDARRLSEMDLMREQNPMPEHAAATDMAGNGWASCLKVVDLCNVIAGPTVGAMLARFGADVTSIQPVTPAIDPWMNIIFGLRAHMGKRSALVDLSSDDGRAILDELLRDADVLTLNMTDTQLAALRLDPKTLGDDFPHLVVLALDAFGGPGKTGDYAGYLGYDELSQALTGIMARFGGSVDDAELHAQVGAIDALTGAWSLFGTALGLYCRNVHGHGQVVRSSLVAVAQFLQMPFFLDPGDGRIEEGPGGRGLQGQGPLYRCYRMRDADIFLAAPMCDWPALRDALGLEGEPRAAEIEAALSEFWYEDLKTRLSGTGAAISRVRSAAELRAEELDYSCTEAAAFPEGGKRFIRLMDHPIGSAVTQAAPAAIRSRHRRIVRPSPAEKFGASTRRVLSELGYSDARIDELLACGVISEAWSDAYLPD